MARHLPVDSRGGSNLGWSSVPGVARSDDRTCVVVVRPARLATAGHGSPLLHHPQLLRHALLSQPPRRTGARHEILHLPRSLRSPTTHVVNRRRQQGNVTVSPLSEQPIPARPRLRQRREPGWAQRPEVTPADPKVDERERFKVPDCQGLPGCPRVLAFPPASCCFAPVFIMLATAFMMISMSPMVRSAPACSSVRSGWLGFARAQTSARMTRGLRFSNPPAIRLIPVASSKSTMVLKLNVNSSSSPPVSVTFLEFVRIFSS